MFGRSVNRYHTNYQMNECEYTRSNQLYILYVQSCLRSIGVWYNLPGEGTPKGFQSRLNIGFMETSKSTLLNVDDLVQEKWGGWNPRTVKIAQISLKISVAGCRIQGAEHTNKSYLPKMMFGRDLLSSSGISASLQRPIATSTSFESVFKFSLEYTSVKTFENTE